jgi:nitrate reductase / nitrite oxidoreductase, beta subunit
MLFYVPPLLPVMSSMNGGVVKSDLDELFADTEKARVPMAYLGRLFAAGNDGKLRYALKKQMAVRIARRHLTVGDVTKEAAERALAQADTTWEQVDAIYKLTSLATFEDRFVIPPSQREMALEMLDDPHEHRSTAGFGFRSAPARGA